MAYDIANFMQRLGEPQFLFNFAIFLPTFTTDGWSAELIHVINSRCTKVPALTFREYTMEPIQKGNEKIYKAIESELAPITLQFAEGVDSLVLRYFEYWRSRIKSINGSYNIPVVYLQDLQICYQDVRNRNTVIFTYIGCYPNSIAPISLGDSEVLHYEITFQPNGINWVGNAVQGVAAKTTDSRELDSPADMARKKREAEAQGY